MNRLDVIKQRLSNQHLAGNACETAAGVVSWLGAVQGQDYFGAMWAIGQRVRGADKAVVKAAFNEGKILRTHMMRPTWHFVAPADIRWIQELTAPRVNLVNGYMYRQMELDEAVFGRTNEIIARALEGENFMSRAELGEILERAGINANGMRLGYILMRAEIDAIICSGPRRGKQFTYALLDERAPQAKSLPSDEALAELTRRYFTGHGPAELEDFVFWSGLTKSQARKGLEMNQENLVQERIGDQTFWLAPHLPLAKAPSPTAHLLPNYDEYLISYRNSDPFLDPAHANMIERQNPLFAHFLVVDGRLLGTWRRDFEKDRILITLRRFVELSDEQEASVRKAGAAFGNFLGLDAAYQSAQTP